MRNALGRGAALVLVAFTLATPALAADKLRAGKASPTSDVMLPVDIGVKTGIFAKHGLDVEVITFSGGAKLHQAMAADAVDIGVGAGTELALLAKGAPEIAIANVAGKVLFLGIGVGADSKARTADDLKGAKIGVSSNGSLTYWLAQELARVKSRVPGRMPTPLDALPCGSMSRSSVRFSAAATLAARFTAVVVLPTPPFWLTTQITRGPACGFTLRAAWGRAIATPAYQTGRQKEEAHPIAHGRDLSRGLFRKIRLTFLVALPPRSMVSADVGNRCERPWP